MTDFAMYIEEATNEFQVIYDRCILFAETSLNELELNYEEASNKVINESGTDADLRLLLEEAEKDEEERRKNLFKKLFESLVKFIKKIGNAIKSIFTKEDIDEIKKDKKITKERITIPDIHELDKADEEFEHELRKMGSMIKSGHKISTDMINSAEEKHKKKTKIILGTSITVTCAALIGIVTHLFKKTDSDTVEVVKVSEGDIDGWEQGDLVFSHVKKDLVPVELRRAQQEMNNAYTQAWVNFNKRKFQNRAKFASMVRSAWDSLRGKKPIPLEFKESSNSDIKALPEESMIDTLIEEAESRYQLKTEAVNTFVNNVKTAVYNDVFFENGDKLKILEDRHKELVQKMETLPFPNDPNDYDKLDAYWEELDELAEQLAAVDRSIFSIKASQQS